MIVCKQTRDEYKFLLQIEILPIAYVQPVGNSDAGGIFELGAEDALYTSVCVGINGGSGLIHDDNGSSSEHGTRNNKKLTLAYTEVRPTLGHFF